MNLIFTRSNAQALSLLYIIYVLMCVYVPFIFILQYLVIWGKLKW